jgi:formylglycine-generating enzyme required for sulfatase activity
MTGRHQPHAAWLIVTLVLTALSAVLPAADGAPRFRAEAWSLPDDVWLGFVEIPAGTFQMGSDPATDSQAFPNERWSADRPQGSLELPTFYIGRYEVTIAQYKAFAESARFRVADPQALVGSPEHPVVLVSWPDALAYCRWLEITLRDWPQTPPPLARLLRDGWRITLPTEAQWEKAARGSDGRIFPWGNEVRRDRANFEGTGVKSVGSVECPECPFGLADMSGNVWEWTRSPLRPYPFAAGYDTAELEKDALWVMRGGHFADPARLVRAATRGAAEPGARRRFIGFRVALSRS